MSLSYQTTWSLDRCIPANRLTVDVRDSSGVSVGATIEAVVSPCSGVYESMVIVPADCFVGYAVLIDSMTAECLAIQAINGAVGACAVRLVMTETGPTAPMQTATAGDGSIAGAIKSLVAAFLDTDANF